MKTLKICGIFIIGLLVTFSVSHAAQFDYARLFSEARQYDPSHFSFDESRIWYNGNTYWFMTTFAGTSGDPPIYPAYLDSPVYADLSSDVPVQLDYSPDYYGTGVGQHSRVFFDFQGFAPPGDDWEDMWYTFFIDENGGNGVLDPGEPTIQWPIPPGSLRQLEIPQNVTFSGDVYHPIISWDPVPFADGYHVRFYALTADGFPDMTMTSDSSPFIAATTYAYTGDLFEDGRRYAVWVQAREDHPWLIPGSAPPGLVLINRSGIFTTYQAFVSEIEDFCEEAASTGDLEGAGPGASADNKFNALMNMINTAGDLIHEGDIDEVCGQLNAVYKKCDGDPHPPDFVEGPAASDLADMIMDLMDEYGCF